MAGTSVTFTVQDQAAREQLERLAVEGQTSDLMGRLGEYFVESTQRRLGFGTGKASPWQFGPSHAAPDGTPWKPLSPGYLAWKKKHADDPNAGILMLRRYLARSIIHQTLNGSTVAWGTNLIYARIHNLGGDGTGKNGTMPRRQFAGVSPIDHANALEIIGDWLADRAGP